MLYSGPNTDRNKQSNIKRHHHHHHQQQQTNIFAVHCTGTNSQIGATNKYTCFHVEDTHWRRLWWHTFIQRSDQMHRQTTVSNGTFVFCFWCFSFFGFLLVADYRRRGVKMKLKNPPIIFCFCFCFLFFVFMHLLNKFIATCTSICDIYYAAVIVKYINLFEMATTARCK